MLFCLIIARSGLDDDKCIGSIFKVLYQDPAVLRNSKKVICETADQKFLKTYLLTLLYLSVSTLAVFYFIIWLCLTRTGN